MSRKPLKVISNAETEWIPPEYNDLDRKAEKMEDRPLIFWGKKMTRDQRYRFQELMSVEYPEGFDPNKPESLSQIEVKGKGKMAVYLLRGEPSNASHDAD